LAQQQNCVQFVAIATVTVTRLHVLSSMARGFDSKGEIASYSLTFQGIS